MTQYHSPVIHVPGLPFSAALLRTALIAVALVLTAATWFGMGAQASSPDRDEMAPRVTLEPVVVVGQRQVPDGAAVAMLKTNATDCANPSVVQLQR